MIRFDVKIFMRFALANCTFLKGMARPRETEFRHGMAVRKPLRARTHTQENRARAFPVCVRARNGFRP